MAGGMAGMEAGGMAGMEAGVDRHWLFHPRARHVRSRAMTPLSRPRSRSRSRSRRLVVLGGALAAGAVAGAAYRRQAGRGTSGSALLEDEPRSLGWGADFTRPDHRTVRTPDGAVLAVWDVAGRRS